MKLSSLALEAFYSVSKTLNFSKAAQTLAITQSALSQRILNLEDQLNTKLFIRESAGVRLTESGCVLLRYCQTQSALEEEVLSKLQPSGRAAGLAGTLRIGGYSSVVRPLLLPRLDGLIRNHPDVKFEFWVRELSVLPGLLKRGEVEMIALDYSMNDSSLEKLKIGEEENVLVEARTGNVRKNTYLDHDPEDKTTQRFFELLGRPFPTQAKRCYLDDIFGILDGVSRGWGRAVVPLHLIKDRKDIKVLAKQKSLNNPITLHFYRQPYRSVLFNEALKQLKDPREAVEKR